MNEEINTLGTAPPEVKIIAPLLNRLEEDEENEVKRAGRIEGWPTKFSYF